MLGDITHVGIMGAHGTGKTTYARRLFGWAQEQFPEQGVALITEIARTCPYSINQNTSAEAQLWIFHSQMKAELSAIRNAEWVICDRTVLDGLAYAEVAGLADVVDACMPMALAWMERYSQLVYFPPMKGRLLSDGFRDTDPLFQKRVHDQLMDWVRLYNINVQEVTEDEYNL